MRSGLHIAVLMGGVSREREISLESGKAVSEALRTQRMNVKEVIVNDRKLTSMNGVRCDVAFIALHGAFGEDGGVQAILEAQDVPYTGSGVGASMRALDKSLSKEIFVLRAVPTPRYELMNGSLGAPRPGQLARKLRFPMVVKPAREGSSLGVSVATNRDELLDALRIAHEFGPIAIVERFIQGRELTVGILGDRALPMIELKPKRRFFDFDAKYVAGLTDYVIDPDLTEEESMKVREAATKAFRALGCSGFGRVDLILAKSGAPYVLEVNTIPGFTKHSLLPMAAKAAGISFPQLCMRILELALEEAGRV